MAVQRKRVGEKKRMGRVRENKSDEIESVEKRINTRTRGQNKIYQQSWNEEKREQERRTGEEN